MRNQASAVFCARSEANEGGGVHAAPRTNEPVSSKTHFDHATTASFSWYDCSSSASTSVSVSVVARSSLLYQSGCARRAVRARRSRGVARSEQDENCVARAAPGHSRQQEWVAHAGERPPNDPDRSRARAAHHRISRCFEAEQLPSSLRAVAGLCRWAPTRRHPIGAAWRSPNAIGASGGAVERRQRAIPPPLRGRLPGHVARACRLHEPQAHTTEVCLSH